MKNKPKTPRIRAVELATLKFGDYFGKPRPDAYAYFGPLTVAEREDGTLWLIDGHHRVLAMMKMGIKMALAQVFKSEGKSHEKEVFSFFLERRVRLTKKEQAKATKLANKKP